MSDLAMRHTTLDDALSRFTATSAMLSIVKIRDGQVGVEADFILLLSNEYLQEIYPGVIGVGLTPDGAKFLREAIDRALAIDVM